jgi:hypothetical protein
MDSDRSAYAFPTAADYAQLNDAQLRSAIRFAEKHMRSLEEGHVALLHAYQDEITAMRRHLLDRVLHRMITAADPLSEQQRRELLHALGQRRMQTKEIAATIRAVTKGRTEQLDALTEIEAMALLLQLEREP